MPLQHRYLKAIDRPTDKNQAFSAIKNIVLQLHSFVYEQWLLRNAHLHGSKLSNQIPFKHLHLVAQITELYAARDHLLCSDRDAILNIELDVICSLPLSGLHSFYYYTKPLMERSLQQAIAFGNQFQRIYDYFYPTIPHSLYNVICLNVSPPGCPPPQPLPPLSRTPSSSPSPPASPIWVTTISN
jgi:hypothetical protein